MADPVRLGAANLRPQEAHMHAVIFEVQIVDRESATSNLKDSIVPTAAEAPGIVAGYWTDIGDDRGLSMIVFESEDAARSYMDSGDPPPPELVKFVRREIGEVVAHT
jgi:hypothetical protein